MSDLQQRFAAFVRTLRGFEDIDSLLQTTNVEGKRRADYLFWNRQVIVEQKVLLTGPNNRPQQFVDRLMEKGKVIVYGQVSTDHLFSRMRDGEEQKRRMFIQITKSLVERFADANKQTRDTREIFSIPAAVGVCIFLNVSAPMLYPDVIRYGVNRRPRLTRDRRPTLTRV